VKNSVYALPSSAEAQEDFEWLLREIQDGGGEAIVLEARLVDGMSDADVRSMFDRARDSDYADIASQSRELAKGLGREPSADALADAKARLPKLRARLAQVHAIDFFGASGRETADGLLRGLESLLLKFGPTTRDSPEMAHKTDDVAGLKGKTWVTRAGVFIDRIGSAWLIRRFIDHDARFKFVPAKGYVPEAGELRFDMFEAEYTHEGDRCTFEVLVDRADLKKDRGLAAIAEIVHDIDMKDGKFGRPEAEGIRVLMTGICNDTHDDAERLARGAAVFDDLYRSFARGRTRR
jgi:hypothetical protein